VIVVDTSAILAYMNAGDEHHTEVAAWLDAEQDDLATTPLIVAEVDRLVAARGGRQASSAFRVPGRMVAWGDRRDGQGR
jgi:predicted nucleic acid-binding protein